MALWGRGNQTQVIQIPNFHWFRGRSVGTVSFWWRTGIGMTTITSFIRQDLTATPAQSNSGFLRPVWWNQAGSLVNNMGGPTISYGQRADTGDDWVLAVWSFTPASYRCWRWNPRTATLLNGGSMVGSTFISKPSNGLHRDLCIGGTENGSELMASTQAIAEIAFFPWAFNAQDVQNLIHSPVSMRDRMDVYIPLRSFRTHTEPARLPPFRMRFATGFGSAHHTHIDPARHPPVPLMGEF